MKRYWWAGVLLSISILLAVLAVAACDPVGDDAIAALGPENPLVRRGPEHRPGQPCIVCHDGALGDPPAFTVAGTIYEKPSSKVGLQGATVTLVDSTGSQYVSPPTNDAGNFYATPNDWNPTFPITTVSVTGSAGIPTMKSAIGRNGSCASCHFNPAGPTSAGQVCIVLDDGGLPL
jgi:hypothetical protein